MSSELLSVQSDLVYRLTGFRFSDKELPQKWEKFLSAANYGERTPLYVPVKGHNEADNEYTNRLKKYDDMVSKWNLKPLHKRILASMSAYKSSPGEYAEYNRNPHNIDEEAVQAKYEQWRECKTSPELVRRSKRRRERLERNSTMAWVNNKNRKVPARQQWLSDKNAQDKGVRFRHWREDQRLVDREAEKHLTKRERNEKKSSLRFQNRLEKIDEEDDVLDTDYVDEQEQFDPSNQIYVPNNSEENSECECDENDNEEQVRVTRPDERQPDSDDDTEVSKCEDEGKPLEDTYE